MKSLSTKQLSIANIAKRYPHEPITVLHPNLDLHWLWEASLRVRKNSASGVDNQTYADYADGRQERLAALLTKAKDGSYRAPPVKRKYIPKQADELEGLQSTAGQLPVCTSKDCSSLSTLRSQRNHDLRNRVH